MQKECELPGAQRCVYGETDLSQTVIWDFMLTKTCANFQIEFGCPILCGNSNKSHSNFGTCVIRQNWTKLCTKTQETSYTTICINIELTSPCNENTGISIL